MNLTKLLIIFIIILSHSIYSYSSDRKIAVMNNTAKINIPLNNIYYVGRGITLEGSKNFGHTRIGGEVIINGASGFYDWQTNGDCRRQIFYYDGPSSFNPLIHSIYMTSLDSTQINSSRRTQYCVSTDGGSTWTYVVGVPHNLRSGYGYLSIDSSFTGPAALIANQYGTPLKSYIHSDAFPGLGSFTVTPSNSMRNYIWPQANLMSNETHLVAGKTLVDSISTDTLAVQVLNTPAGQWQGQTQYFRSGASDHSEMRFTTATGPSGKALLVMSPVNDNGGNFGRNRIFYWTSSNYGVNWNGPNIMYNTHIDTDGDTSRPWIGLDAVYDKYGNFYVAFNTVGLQGKYSTAKIWINKNGTANYITVRNTDIAGAMTSAAGTPMNDVCSMDWPSISVSEHADVLTVAYSVAKQNDIVNGFNSMDIYASVTGTSSFQFAFHDQITSGLNDERFVSLNRELFGSFFRKVPMVYQKDPQPGTSAPDAFDNAPLSRSTLVYREYEFIAEFTGVMNYNTLPNNHRLHQNYPNPFNPSTLIKFDMPRNSHTNITIYDNTGRLVETILNQSLSPGTYEVQWNAGSYPSGVYFYRLETDGFSQTKKMLLIK